MTEHLKAVQNAKPRIKLHKPNANFIERLEKRDERDKKIAKISDEKKYAKKTQTEEFRDVRNCWSRVEKVKSSLPPLEKKE